MEHTYKQYRTQEDFLNENISFLETVRPEDIEYTGASLDIIQGLSQSVPRDILEIIRNVDVINDLYYRPFPKDGGELRIGSTLFSWQVDYFDQSGKRIQTYKQALHEPIIDRVVVILAPKDRMLVPE